MKCLFVMDKKNHDDCIHETIRLASRSIIIHDGKLAMVHSLKYDYYKFPGGGIKTNELAIDALIRETAEEVGLVIKPETIKEYGYVRQIQKSSLCDNERFIQDSYYYICEVTDQVVNQHLDDYEKDERFVLEFVDPYVAIKTNRKLQHATYYQSMAQREAMILELLLNDGILQ